MSLDCTECQKAFATKSNLTRHLRMVHGIEIEREDTLPHDYNAYNYKCLEGCQVSYKYNRELRTHLKNEHNISLVELTLEFPNTIAFETWLAEEEETSCSQYVHVTASKKKTKGIETYYFECSRSGHTKSSIVEGARKRKHRKNGTFKLNRGCTSQIIVTKFRDDTYKVNYFKTHYGHDIDVDHLRLSKRDRVSIASKLMLGMPISSVLDSALNKKRKVTNRLNLLQRKDVINIKKSFNINDKRNISADLININLFILECQQDPDNPIIYHNLNEISETDNICLMIMTKRQCEFLSKNWETLAITGIELVNCDFELITLFSLTEGQNFPVACMIVNKNNFKSCQLFFNKIKERIGNVSARILITDVKDFYSKAWKSVMGPVKDYYNLIQIDFDWRLHLNKITCEEWEATKVKRQWVLDTLKILQETEEEDEFLDNLDETIKLMSNDKDFEEFLKYFLKQYHNPKQWALCYREEIDETVPTIDAILKSYINDTNRFDKIFHAILRYLRDRITNDLCNNKAHLVNDINERHESAMNKNHNVEVCSENVWNLLVDSETTKKSYIVLKHSAVNCCKTTCSTCNICIHMFSCSCADFFINNTICEHIHYIWMTYFNCFVHNIREEIEYNVEEEIIIIQVMD